MVDLPLLNFIANIHERATAGAYDLLRLPTITKGDNLGEDLRQYQKFIFQFAAHERIVYPQRGCGRLSSTLDCLTPAPESTFLE
jgi:hypothetical protein